MHQLSKQNAVYFTHWNIWQYKGIKYWYMQRTRMKPEMLCQVKEDSYKRRHHITCFHFDEISKTGPSIDTESELTAASDGEKNEGQRGNMGCSKVFRRPMINVKWYVTWKSFSSGDDESIQMLVNRPKATELYTFFQKKKIKRYPVKNV